MSGSERPDDKESTGRPPARRSLVRRFLPLSVILAGFVLFFVLDLDKYLSFAALEQHHEWLRQQVADNHAAAALAFTVVYALTTAFSVPGGAILTILGGFLFGLLLGTAYAVVGATVGSAAVFLAARTAFHDVLERKAGRAVQRMKKGFRDNALNYLLFLRLVPVFPFWLVNLVPALVGVPLRTYLIGTFLGIIPGTFVYASVGNGLGTLLERGERPDLGVIFDPEILIPILGLALFSLIPVVYKRAKRPAPGAPDGGEG